MTVVSWHWPYLREKPCDLKLMRIPAYVRSIPVPGDKGIDQSKVSYTNIYLQLWDSWLLINKKEIPPFRCSDSV